MFLGTTAQTDKGEKWKDFTILWFPRVVGWALRARRPDGRVLPTAVEWGGNNVITNQISIADKYVIILVNDNNNLDFSSAMKVTC